MRLEGFLSLMACVMLLFLIGLGAGALRAELSELDRSVPDLPPSSPSESSAGR